MKKQVIAFIVFMFFSILIAVFLLQSISVIEILEAIVSFGAGFYICQIGIFGENKGSNEKETNSCFKQALQISLGAIFLIVSIWLFLKTDNEIYVFMSNAALGVLTSGIVETWEKI